jgi:hypothetical protein
MDEDWVLVQILQSKSGGENRIPNFGRSFVFDAMLSEFELRL